MEITGNTMKCNLENDLSSLKLVLMIHMCLLYKVFKQNQLQN